MIKEIGMAEHTPPSKHHGIDARREARHNAPFIAWDGEGLKLGPQPFKWNTGRHTLWTWSLDRDKADIFDEDGKLFVYSPPPQPYCLLAYGGQDNIGDRIMNEKGLDTEECLDFIIDAKQQYPDSIFIGFGFNYDINQILKDLPIRCLDEIQEKNETRWLNYYIKWYPSKYFTCSRKTNSGRQSATIYDVLGFFQSSFLMACEKYLGENHEGLELVTQGKAQRSEFTWTERDFMVMYNEMELHLLVQVMNTLRRDLASVDIYPSQWHGPGAIANQVMKKYNIPICRNIPEGVSYAAQYAYAGGRFELFQLGYYKGRVYEYDIRSAYPSIISQLPDLTQGSWEYAESFEPESFGVWNIDYVSPYGDDSTLPEPLFCRSKMGTISFPHKVIGWYWTPEAALVHASYIRGGWVFRPTEDCGKPFQFVEELYQQRAEYKKPPYNPAERALKLILNSLYGKLCQLVGGSEGNPPRWHQLEWAGYITSATRAKIYRAAMLAPNNIIATETDALFSTTPLALDEGEALGQWERKEFSEIAYLQSGYYYATPIGEEGICKYRGMDKDREGVFPAGLPYRTVLDHLCKPIRSLKQRTDTLHTTTTRFIGLGMALNTNSVWRSWETNHKAIHLDGIPWFSKRSHIRKECTHCQIGITLGYALHPLVITGYRGHSHYVKLPWLDEFDMMLIADDLDPDETTDWMMDDRQARFGKRLTAYQ
jgi:hypothetical protein